MASDAQVMPLSSEFENKSNHEQPLTAGLRGSATIVLLYTPLCQDMITGSRQGIPGAYKGAPPGLWSTYRRRPSYVSIYRCCSMQCLPRPPPGTHPLYWAAIGLGNERYFPASSGNGRDFLREFAFPTIFFHHPESLLSKDMRSCDKHTPRGR